MSEKNIIEYDFGNNNHNKEGDSDSPSNEGEIIEHDFRFKKDDSNKSDFSSMLKLQNDLHKSFEEGYLLGDVMRKINRLRPTQNSIIQGDSIVKDYTKDEVFNWLKNATDSEISKRPGFYFALMRRYKNLRRIG
jgi:hypothetical protein